MIDKKYLVNSGSSSDEYALDDKTKVMQDFLQRLVALCSVYPVWLMHVPHETINQLCVCLSKNKKLILKDPVCNHYMSDFIQSIGNLDVHFLKKVKLIDCLIKNYLNSKLLGVSVLPINLNNRVHLNRFSKMTSSSYKDTGQPSFCGLPNMGNTCYIDAVLQIIAACYADNTKPDLKYWIDSINNRHASSQGIRKRDMAKFIAYLDTLESVKSIMGKRLYKAHDPDEFIHAIKTYFIEDYRVKYRDNIVFMVKKVSATKKWSTNKLYHHLKPSDYDTLYPYLLCLPVLASHTDLTTMIKQYQEKFIEYEQPIALPWNKVKELSKQRGRSAYMQAYGSKWLAVAKTKPFITLPKGYMQQTLLQLPNKLYIRLDRNLAGIKLTTPVTGALNITIYPNPNERASVKFGLKGFIVHLGSDADNGHYVAYVKRLKQWYKVDDYKITFLTTAEAEVASKQAYLLLGLLILVDILYYCFSLFKQ